MGQQLRIRLKRHRRDRWVARKKAEAHQAAKAAQKPAPPAEPAAAAPKA